MKTTTTQKANRSVKKAFVSMAVAGAMVFGLANQASAKIHSMDSFLSYEAETISNFAHPTATYLSSTNEGGGVRTIYYEGLFGGRHTMQVYGKADGSGLFQDIQVLYDSGSVKPFLAVSLIRELVGDYLSQAEPESAVAQQAADYAARVAHSGNGETMCEATLKFKSAMYSY